MRISFAFGANKVWRPLGFVFAICISLAVGGCASVSDAPSRDELAMVNVWSMPGVPVVTYRINQDGRVTCLKETDGKRQQSRAVAVSTEHRDRLLELARAAVAEIKAAPKIENIADGANIQIALDRDYEHDTVIRNYAQRFYKFEHVPALFEELEKVLRENGGK